MRQNKKASPRVSPTRYEVDLPVHSQTEALAKCARALNSSREPGEIFDALARGASSLLGARFAAVLMRDAEMRFRLRATDGEDPDIVRDILVRHKDQGLRSGEALAERVAEGADLLCVPVATSPSGYEDLLPSGMVIAAALRAPQGPAAILVYSQPEGTYGDADKSLVAHLTGLTELALANVERHSAITRQATELQQLLEISAELTASSELDQFMKRFVLRAAEFLGFGRSFIALVEEGGCLVRWAAENGEGRPRNLALKSRLTERVLAGREPFWTEDITLCPDADPALAAEFHVKQYLVVPLLGADGKAIGLFAVLDRLDGAEISAGDVRRARALAAEVAAALEAAQNLALSRQHRACAENLMSLARELNSSFRLPDFLKSFAMRAAEMLGARAALLALAHGRLLEAVCIHEPNREINPALLRRLNSALTDLAGDRPQVVVSGSAGEFLGPGVAGLLEWKDLAVARLSDAEGELLGLLCLVDRGQVLLPAEQSLLEALAGHAAIALDNARLFSRIEQSNKQWVEIFDAISDFIVVHDESNRVVRVNRSLAEFIGVEPKELIGVTMRALVSITAEAGSQPCPFCRTGEDGSGEFLHPVLERTYLVSTSRTREEDQAEEQTIHVLKDISDRREAERRYQELFDNIQEGLFFSSPEGRFIEVNDALVRMLGYGSREELLQVNIPEQLYAAPQQRQRFCQAIEQMGVLRNFEEVLRRKDGSVIHSLQNAVAVRDAQGRVVQYRGVMLDITELKTFQAELQHERDFNSKILNNTQSMILVADPAGVVTYANRRCFEAGAYTENDLLGHRLEEFVAPSRREAFAAAFACTLDGQQVDNLELAFVRGDGKTSQLSVNLSPMRDDQGKPTSIVAVMTDITDAALLQAKLMHTEKMAAVGQLVSGVAHEVNNPLTAVLGFADLLVEHPDLPDFAKQDLRVIVQEAQRTKVIVQNLLSFARQTPPQKKPVKVNSILHQTLQLRSYDFHSHGVEIVERLAPELQETVGDAHQLQQVFLNILNNAYDAVRESGRRGRIEIETADADGFIEIAFRDNGDGITFSDRIFDPFFTTKEVGKGTGLGLSICYGIVREHGGEIVCHNNQGGQGACFRVRLPAAERGALVAAGDKDP